MTARSLALRRQPGRFAVCQLTPRATIPDWALRGGFFTVSRTGDELSVVCEQGMVPPGVRAEPGWACLKVEGPFAFDEVGILAAIVGPMAKAEIGVFAVSTYDTDYVLIKEKDLAAAVDSLREAGHEVEL